ncbi:unnamed protein product [Hapterophycus canaliculatus]
MREDLPHEEPLPALWSISLAEGGDIIDECPRLDEFTVVQALKLGEPRCRYWRVEEGDSEPHVLCETRFLLPERLAVPQLGRLRELMLREARLLDALSHDCIVPLERAWLEQRTGFGRPEIGARASCCRCPLASVGCSRAAPGADERSSLMQDCSSGRRLECQYRGESVTAAADEGCVQHSGPESGAAAAAAAAGIAADAATSAIGVIASGSCRKEFQPARFYAGDGDGPGSEGDAAAFLLRSWVPLTLDDVDGDDDDRHDTERGKWSETTHAREGTKDGVRRGGPQYGGIPQLRWGGDDATDWKGTAEPKPTTNDARSSARTPTPARLAKKQSPGRRTRGVASTAENYCTDSNRQDAGSNRVRENARRQGERTLCLTAFLLLPDWLPLSVWFETEFEPRVAAPDDGDGAANTEAVIAPDDWAIVWQHLTRMFLSVVRGVEHFHTKGFVHNSIRPCSVWVAPDGRCCVGNLGQITPPGCRRPPLRREACAARHCHFASPEFREGGTVDSHSDVYALGVLLLEFWRNYALSRWLGKMSLMEGGDIFEIFTSRAHETAQPEEWGLLDSVLVRSMLSRDPFDRPDCFEVLDILGEKVG